jgi:hypothetical protein
VASVRRLAICSVRTKGTSSLDRACNSERMSRFVTKIVTDDKRKMLKFAGWWHL